MFLLIFEREKKSSAISSTTKQLRDSNKNLGQEQTRAQNVKNCWKIQQKKFGKKNFLEKERKQEWERTKVKEPVGKIRWNT